MATDVVKQIKKATRRKFTAEEKIRVVLEGLRGETPECRQNCISLQIQSVKSGVGMAPYAINPGP